MKRYVYKLNFKYVKHPEELLKHGFSLYKPEGEEEGIYFYAISLILNKEALPVKRIIKHVGTIYTKAKDDEKKEIDPSGKRFAYDKTNKRYNWKPLKKDYDDITKAQLCVCNTGSTRNLLFINAADKTEYYDAEIMRQMVANIIDKLLDENVIYEKRTPKLLK
jgi:hypothetical protein